MFARKGPKKNSKKKAFFNKKNISRAFFVSLMPGYSFMHVDRFDLKKR